MTSEISWILTSQVTAFDQPAFESLMQEMCSHFRESLPGLQAMVWYLSEDGTTCQMFVTVESSESALVYFEKYMVQFQNRFEALLTPQQLVVYGDVSADLKTLLAPSSPIYVTTIGGFVR
ncbi:hypothetical protein [Pseudovibrio exalbescens]|uniref:ABM domain-containing protein n=1 Tax=Pseudovibrio exalbescens TaxID=197461 RepID=A0A1U7JD71_9HYPH|nr:hypothetical protein [Pseudovibrio exalbescens]OKL42683.1 hypothetical protein A3843_18760 [Pseudovibrio exalbescens]